MVQSKSKGNVFERKIAKILSERFAEFTGVETSFRRDASSGSFFGATNQKRLATHLHETANFGDIIAPSNFLYSLECKHYKTAPSFASMVKQEYKMFDTWIAQATQDAVNAGREMLVIVKFNSVGEFVITARQDSRAFGHYKGYALVTLEDWLMGPDTDYFTN